MSAVHVAPVMEPVAVHHTLAELFQRLDDERVRWCLLRGESDLAAPTGDVDLLVDPRHLPALRRVATGLRFARVPSWGYATHQFLLTYDAASDRWLKLDVVTELAYGRRFSLPTDAAAACLDRRRRDGRLARLADDDRFWTLLLHCIVDKRRMSRDQRAQLAALAPRATTDGPLARMVADVCPPGWSVQQLLDDARRESWDELLAAGPALVERWRQQRQLVVWRRRIANEVAARSAKLLRLHWRQGVRLALVGGTRSDRASVADSLQRRFYFRVLIDDPAAPAAGGQVTAGLRGWRRQARSAWRRRRGHLIVHLDDDASRAARPDVVARIDPQKGLDMTVRDVTTQAWGAYVRRWDHGRHGEGR